MDVESYIGRYTVEIRPIPDNLGGGYEACIPKLGRFAVRGDGNTVEEALRNMEIVQRERLSAYISEGLDFPKP